MRKKILFIQPYYFYGGHFFQSFNNLIKNIGNKKNYEFLVSINKNLKEKVFFSDYIKVKKNNKIKSFESPKNSLSNQNIFKALTNVFIMRKKFDVFFFYDFHMFYLSYFFLLFQPLFKKKKIIIYVFFGPEFLDKFFFKLVFFKLFLKTNRVEIFCRTNELKNSWQKRLYNFKNNIKYFQSLDYPSIDFKKVPKKGKLKFGCVGQIRRGKSLQFLNSFFKDNKDLKFSVIGGYPNQKTKKDFGFLDSSFIKKKDFLEFRELIKECRSLDYILLLYDNFFDKRMEVSTFFLASSLRIPVICFKKNNWLFKRVKKFKCGYIIDNLDQFKNFPKRGTRKYKGYLTGLRKFSELYLNVNTNEKMFYEKIIK